MSPLWPALAVPPSNISSGVGYHTLHNSLNMAWMEGSIARSRYHDCASRKASHPCVIPRWLHCSHSTAAVTAALLSRVFYPDYRVNIMGFQLVA